PRCNEAWSLRSLPACSLSPPSAACSDTDSSIPLKNTARREASVAEIRFLVMRRHPFRHRLGLFKTKVCVNPQEEEKSEVKRCQDATHDGLDRVGARTRTDLAQIDEAEGEDCDGD